MRAILTIICILITLHLGGHSGRTDKYGGHYNRKTGEYHYHNSGYAPRKTTKKKKPKKATKTPKKQKPKSKKPKKQSSQLPLTEASPTPSASFSKTSSEERGDNIAFAAGCLIITVSLFRYFRNKPKRSHS